MRKGLLLGLIVVWAAPGTAWAQGPAAVQLPGSLSVSAGTLAPTERGNVIGSVTTEQGVTPWRKGSVFVVGFANVTARQDRDGLPWNRTRPGTAGLKVVSVTRAGVVQAVLGVTAYDRGDSVRASKAAYLSYWAGWRGDRASSAAALRPDAFPGYAWATTGYVTAAEPINWVTSVAMQQGATVGRVAGVGVTPFVGAAASGDSRGYSWNQRVQADAGVKLSREVLAGVVEVGVAHRHERNRQTQASRGAPVVFVNLWLGWSPAVGLGR